MILVNLAFYFGYIRLLLEDGAFVIINNKISLIRLSLDQSHMNLQVGGYAEVYNKTVVFATMRGTGHSITSRYPDRAQKLFLHMTRS